MSKTVSLDRESSIARSVSSTKALDVLLLLNRFTLAWYMMLAGFEKVQGELAGGIGSFHASGGFSRRGAFMPEFAAPLFGYAWPWLETIFGFTLLIGLFGRFSAIVNTVLFACISFALLTAGELLPRHHAIVFATNALLLCALGVGRYSVDSLIRGRKR
jgi:uncharacterized membrane protein YphA (DoxX/SURF4 family)